MDARRHPQSGQGHSSKGCLVQCSFTPPPYKPSTTIGTLSPNDLTDLNDDDEFFDDADTDPDCDLDASSASGAGCFDQTTTLRFTNVRVNATGVPESGTVTVSVNIASSFAISLPNRNGDVADAFQGLISMVGDTVAGLQC